MKSKKETKSSKKSLFEEAPVKLFTQDYYNEDILKRVKKYLLKRKISRPTQKRRCVKGENEGRIDEQVKLRCRQLPHVVTELRKALLKNDWNSVATLAMILCHPGLKCYISIIFRVCFILLLTHPKSNFSLLQSFIRHTSGYILEEDVNKFLKILFISKKKLFKERGKGKYIRKKSDYRVVRDINFEDL